MFGRSVVSISLMGCLGAALAVACPTDSAAQSTRDFLLRTPRATLSFRGGYSSPGEGSQVFDEAREQLTLNQGDFAGFLIGADLAYRISERLDLSFSLEHSRRSRDSESRLFDADDLLPIEQTTRLLRTPFTVGFRAYLRERGRSLSEFIWIPNGWTPYLGAGVGVMRYTFEQVGEFVDNTPIIDPDDPENPYYEIFGAQLLSSGSALALNAVGGVEVPAGPRFGIVAEVRYIWAKAGLSRSDFRNFDDIDLSGTQATIGVTVRF